MPKNILVFSDGTGQAGGMFFDEARSNIYKLYRATRCGPDSCINPEEQIAIYDGGLGTRRGSIGTVSNIIRIVENVVSQATGLGITTNIIDCYAAILQFWEPGDRIYLFGFSRGAYTVRCLGGVLALCGVPTTMQDGSPRRRDAVSVRRIAKEAVERVYQHVGSPNDKKHFADRLSIARHFRARYSSANGDRSNAYPYFIGVFDTVAALGKWSTFIGLTTAVLLLLIGVSWGLSFFFLSFLCIVGLSVSAAALALLFCYGKTHLKWARGVPGVSFWKSIHFTAPRMKFYDETLNPNVRFARHAISIDENRKDFPRVGWGTPGENSLSHQDGDPEWFEQIWFAGNHSDIGGSYPENEARLSDIALSWMVEAATKVPDGIKVDASLLQMHPSPAGMQHDERQRGRFGRFWGEQLRKPPDNAPLHPSVLARFGLPGVVHHGEVRKYRPDGLRTHQAVRERY